LIIEDPNPPFHWDEEQVLTLSDWYHDQMPVLIPTFLSNKKNPSGAEPIPYSALMNDAHTASFDMQCGKTYYFRIINTATFSQIFLNFEDHNMTIIEVDGVYTQPREVESLWIATAQRYGVLITAKADATRNYAFTSSLDIEAFDHTTKYLQTNATGQLTYNAAKPAAPVYELDAWRVIDDFTLIPLDGMPLLAGTPDQIIHLDLNFTTIAEQNRYV
jgi:iron transport multicopper oxidase